MSTTTTRRSRGFTLIELMVSLGIFSIIMLLASASYISLIYASKEVRASTNAIDNVSTAVGSMVLNIRTGSCTSLAVCNGNSSDSITFINVQGCTVTYSLNNKHAIQKTLSGGKCIASPEALTDANLVKIKTLTFNKHIFNVRNATSNTQARQMFTTILVQGIVPAVKSNSISQTFSIETGATMRKVSIMP